MSDAAAQIDAVLGKFADIHTFALRVRLRATGSDSEEWLELYRAPWHGRGDRTWCWASGRTLANGTRHEDMRSREQVSFAAALGAARTTFPEHQLRTDTIEVEVEARGRRAKKLSFDTELRRPAVLAICEAFGAPVPESAPQEEEAPQEPARSKGRARRIPSFVATPGKVAIFVNAQLRDPDSGDLRDDDDEMDEDDEAGFWVDHDCFESMRLSKEVCTAEEIGSALGNFSRGESFADDAARAIEALGVKVTSLFALYGSAAELSPGPLPDFWKRSPGVIIEAKRPTYAGSFAFEKKR